MNALTQLDFRAGVTFACCGLEGSRLRLPVPVHRSVVRGNVKRPTTLPINRGPDGTFPRKRSAFGCAPACGSKVGLFVFLAGRIPIRAFAFRADFGLATTLSAGDPLVAAAFALPALGLDFDPGHTQVVRYSSVYNRPGKTRATPAFPLTIYS